MIIIYTDPAMRTVSVMHAFHREEGWSDAELIAYHMARCPPGTRDAQVFDPALLPPHGEYQPAWRLSNGIVTVDMAHAREVHRDLLRERRGVYFTKLDGEMARAQEEGRDTSEIRKTKQYLRDITKSPRIAAAQTTEELRAIQIDLAGGDPMPVIRNEEPMLSQMMPQAFQAIPPAPLPPPPSWSIQDLMKRAEQPEPEAPEIPPPLPPSEPALEHVEHAELSAAPPPMEAAPAPQEPVYIPPEPAAPSLPPSLPPPPVLEDHRAPDVFVTDAERKRQAIDRVAFAVERVGDGQIRYEIAVQAENGNTDALEMLQDEAAVYGTTAASLARQIITQRTLQEQRVMRAYAAKARALMSIESAAGTDIDDVAEAYVHKIMEEGNAGTS